MRIVGGMHRGRALVAPKGQSTRPTADKNRQAIFNILEHAAWSPGLEGRQAIDIFAGAGGLGLEALSRGAAFCLFVDADANARAAIGANIQSLRLEDCARIDGRDAARLGPAPEAGEKFDLAFLDPPYGQSLGELTLAALASGGWLAPGGLVVVERGVGEPRLDVPPYETLDTRTWGGAQVAFLKAQ